MPIILQSGTGDAADLVTATYATNALAAGGVTLSTPQQLILPTLITAASREVVRYCNRPFVATAFDEILTPEGGRQDRNEPASAKLSYFPVQSLSRVYTGRTTALLITNGDQVTNQVAYVQLASTGAVDYYDLVYTGLVLTRIASGAAYPTTLTWASYPTVQALANAINALGNGWTAVLQSSGLPSLGLFPSADLVGAREPKNAFSPGASLDLFTAAADSYDIDRATGILRLYGWGGSSFGWGGGYGDPFGAAWDGLGDTGGGWPMGWSQYRISYTAGFSVVPESIQQVTAELVKASFERLNTDMSLKSESIKDYSWTARDLILTLPDWALQILQYYKDWKV